MSTVNKGLILPANGTDAGTWDQPVNGNGCTVDAALGLWATLNSTNGTVALNGTAITLPPSYVSTVTIYPYQCGFWAINGTLTANVTYTVPSGVGGQWTFSSSGLVLGGFTCTIGVAGSSGSTVTVQPNQTGIVYSDGTNIGFSVSPGSYGSVLSLSSNTTLTAGQSGALVELTGSTPFTVTLPTPAAGTTSLTYTFWAQSAYQTLAGGTFTGPGNAVAPSSTFVVPAYSLVKLVCDGAYWVVVSVQQQNWTQASTSAATYTATGLQPVAFTGTGCTVTLPSATAFAGQGILWLSTTSAYAVISASANVYPLGGATAGTAILAAATGAWAALLSDGTNWRTLASAGGPITTALFTTTGAWVVPAGVTSVLVDGVGGGGGGGYNGGGGGGGGGAVRGTSLSVTPGNTLNITVGSGGPAGTSGAVNGTAGSGSVVAVSGGATLLTLPGGLGGAGNLAGAGGAAGGTGGTAGTAGSHYTIGDGSGNNNVATGGSGGGNLFSNGAAGGAPTGLSQTLAAPVAAAYGTGGGGGTPPSAGAPGYVLLNW